MKYYHSILAASITLVALLAAVQTQAANAVLTGDAYVLKSKPTSNYGPKKTLSLKKDQNVYLKFSLATLPPGTTAAQVSSATMKVWVDKVIKPGAFQAFRVAGAWEENTIKFSTAPAPGAEAASSVVLDAASQKQFVTLDITNSVKGWLADAATNHGIALVAPATSLLNAALPSKEDVATGHLAELEINIASVKTAFVHTSTAANKISGNGTEISNPLCDGDPTCLLFITQKLNPNAIIYNNSPVGVYYNPSQQKWDIFNQNNTAIPLNAQFNVLVLKQ